MALGPSEGGPGGVLDESAAPAGFGVGAGTGAARAAGAGAAGGDGAIWINSYERTKAIADRRARRAIAAGQNVVVVYPGVIYGPGEMTEGNLVVRHILDLLHRRLPALLGTPERRWCHVFVDDVARGIGLALERSPPGGRYVLGGENTSLGDFYRLVEELSGVPVPRRRLPDGLAKTIGAVQKTWARLRGTTPSLTPDLVEVYRHHWAYSSARAAAELGYSFRPLREGLATTLAWVRETGQWRRGAQGPARRPRPPPRQARQPWRPGSRQARRCARRRTSGWASSPSACASSALSGRRCWPGWRCSTTSSCCTGSAASGCGATPSTRRADRRASCSTR